VPARSPDTASTGGAAKGESGGRPEFRFGRMVMGSPNQNTFTETDWQTGPSPLIKPTDSPVLQAKAREQLLDRLVKVLDTPLAAQGGTLRVLRKGFQHGSASLKMCQFRPADNLNPTTLKLYGRVRLRVMRQVHYSKSSNKSIDLVFFVNGIPVATAELKTDCWIGTTGWRFRPGSADWPRGG